MRYLLDSAMITEPGMYHYYRTTVERARIWLAKGPVESAFESSEAAEGLAILLDIPIIFNRRSIRMQIGDQALVFQSTFAPSSPRSKKMLNDPLWVLHHSKLGMLRRY